MRGVLLAAMAVVVSVSLVGCSEKDVRSEPSPTASVSESVVPKEESAEEFIRRWNETLNEAQAGKPAEWEELTKDCLRCTETTELFAGIYRDGGYVKTEGRSVVGVAPDAEDGRPDVFVVQLTSAPTKFKRAKDAPEESLEGGEGEIRVLLSRSGGNWRVQDMWQVAE